MKLFGKDYDNTELTDYVGDIKTLAGVKPYTLFDGPERGVFAIDVWTGSGLSYTIVPDRGMSVCNTVYKGIPIDWMSGTGPTSPFLYDPSGWNWLRSFHGGLIHTCGLNNVGEPCSDIGIGGGEERFGAHGRIGNTPARELSWRTEKTENGYRMVISGVCRIVAVQGENLRLERTIISELGKSEILVEDTVTNLGAGKTPVFLLYHCNFGFPLLSPDAELSIPAREYIDLQGNPVTDGSVLYPPSDSPEEKVLYPVIDDNEIAITLFNPCLGIHGTGVRLSYRKSELPYLTLWKFFQKRTYVLGVEPGTCRVEGRKAEKEKNRAVYLNTDERLQITLKIKAFEHRAITVSPDTE